MKIKIFTRKLKIDISDDLLKVLAFYKSKGINLEFSIEGTTIPLKDAPTLLYLPNDGKCDILAYIFDRYEENRSISFALNFSKTLQCVEVATATHDDAVDYTWKLIAHEIMHCFFHKLNNMNIFTAIDPMDVMPVNGTLIPYYQNDNPYSETGNFAEAIKRLKPHWTKLFPEEPGLYKPPNFALKELVSPAILAKYGDKAWEFLDERILRNIQWLRDKTGKAIKVNWGALQYRGFDACEYRKQGVSQHNHGRGIDFDVVSMTSTQVCDFVKKYKDELPEPNMWVEVGVGHNHWDVRYSDKKGLYFFKPV